MAGVMASKSFYNIPRKKIIIFMIVISVITLGLVFYNVNSNNIRKGRDKTRIADINTLNDQLTLYYVHFGRYPSLDNLNNTKWLANNMPDLKPSTTQDPSGHSLMVGSPQPKAFAYKALTFYGKDGCDNFASYCMSYTLIATLEGGGVYKKSS